jgi:regulator of protease activity HflC (stomatin/prohibitin superfamily)
VSTNLKIGIFAPIAILFIMFIAWFACSNNFETPAGYVGYVKQGAVFGEAKFLKMQRGPTSSGRIWLAEGVNVSITPYTYSERFYAKEAILSKDNLEVGYSVHLWFKIRSTQIQEFVEGYTILELSDSSEKIVRTAYENNFKEPLRTYSRGALQSLNGLDVKNKIDSVGMELTRQMKNLAEGTPFEILKIFVGNVQYPKKVSDAVSAKLAATQLLEQKDTEIKISGKDAEKRVKDAEGIAKAMEIINSKLTAQYLQHEAIEAQKAMAGSPNHSVVYIPSGMNGIPLVGAIEMPGAPKKDYK